MNAEGTIAARPQKVASWDVIVRYEGEEPIEGFWELMEADVADVVPQMQEEYPHAAEADPVGACVSSPIRRLSEEFRQRRRPPTSSRIPHFP